VTEQIDRDRLVVAGEGIEEWRPSCDAAREAVQEYQRWPDASSRDVIPLAKSTCERSSTSAPARNSRPNRAPSACFRAA